MPFFDGLENEGILIINAEEPLTLSDEQRASLQAIKARLFYAAATSIAMKIAKTELSVNMAMVGALAGATRIVTLEAIRESLQERFAKKKFVASATTAALDDTMKSKFAEISQ